MKITKEELELVQELYNTVIQGEKFQTYVSGLCNKAHPFNYDAIPPDSPPEYYEMYENLVNRMLTLMIWYHHQLNSIG